MGWTEYPTDPSCRFAKDGKQPPHVCRRNDGGPLRGGDCFAEAWMQLHDESGMRTQVNDALDAAIDADRVMAERAIELGLLRPSDA
jgi:hypothetical protein